MSAITQICGSAIVPDSIKSSHSGLRLVGLQCLQWWILGISPLITSVLCLGCAQFYHLSYLLVPKLLFTDNGRVHMDLPFSWGSKIGWKRSGCIWHGGWMTGSVSHAFKSILQSSQQNHYIEDSVVMPCPQLLYPSLERGWGSKGGRHTPLILSPTHNCWISLAGGASCAWMVKEQLLFAPA